MAKRALLVGINTYDNIEGLEACVADAEAMASALSRHKDKEERRNYDCVTLLDRTEDDRPISRPALRSVCQELFAYKGSVLFYFSGHGALTETGGYLCTSDASRDDVGINMDEIMRLATQSPASEILMILDCCHAGELGNSGWQNPSTTTNPLATIREGLTIIAASRSLEPAVEAGGHGLFTAAILDALEGGAADHNGWVTAPSIFAYVRRRFGAWNSTPIFKSHANDVTPVRECAPLIDRLKLRRLVSLFPTQNYKLQLDPEYEPEDEHGNMRGPVNAEKIEVAQLLKEYRDTGLVKPTIQNEQLFWTARRSHSVELTPRGHEYWWLVKHDKI